MKRGLKPRYSGWGRYTYDVRTIFGFFDPLPPLVRKFTQPPLLRLLTTSAFEGTPSPPLCGRHIWKPPPLFHSSQTQICRFCRLTMEIRVESEPERIAKLRRPVLSAKGDVFVTSEGVYREVQLDLTPEMKVFHLIFEKWHNKIARDLSNNIYNTSISGVKFSWTALYCPNSSNFQGYSKLDYLTTETKLH